MTGKTESGTLIVTGASRGIGAAVAMLAGERGYAVAVNFATGQTEANNVVAKIVAAGGRALAIHADIAQEHDIIRMFETAEQQLGPIKALVNNAAITGGFARVEDVSGTAIARVFAVNVAGTILCSREAVRRMSTQRGGAGGAIVNISPAPPTQVPRESGCIMPLRKVRSTASRSGWLEKSRPKASG